MFSFIVLSFIYAFQLLDLIIRLLRNGGTYSYISENGWLHCGIPLFTNENWLFLSFELFVVPSLIILAAVRSAFYFYNKIKGEC